MGYADERLSLPLIQTLVYVGPEEDPENGQHYWTFAEPGYREPVDEAADEADVRVAFSEDQLHMILDIAGLTRMLLEVAPDPIHASPLHPGPASDADLAQLTAEIERFFRTSEMQSITVTIRFTDDGVSLTRRPDQTIELLLFPHPRLEPDQEASLRALCQSAGLKPSDDYLSNYGRTRVLTYPISAEAQLALPSLAARMFLESYGMRRGDTLIYQCKSNAPEAG